MANIVNARDIYLQASTRAIPITLILTSKLSDYGVDLSIANTSSIILVEYTYRLGNGTDNSWDNSILLSSGSNNTYRWEAPQVGVYILWCTGRDVNGATSTPINTTVVIGAPGFSALEPVIVGPNLKLNWTISESNFVIDSYEIRYGNSWENGSTTIVGTTKATTYTVLINYLGTRVWWVAAKNIAGDYSKPTGANVTINPPTSVSNIRIDSVDNNALIYWTEPPVGVGQVPIASYAVTKGPTYATSIVVGSNGNSTFTSIFEQASGNYTYWVVAIDTAGNAGASLSKTAKIDQPPDYVLRNNYNSNFFSATTTNLYNESGTLVGPAILGEAWNYHYNSRGWLNPDAQVAAGYPVYSTPSSTTASYEEVLDYSITIPSTVITSTISVRAVVGTVDTVCIISWKVLSSDPWTVLPAGTSSLIPSFRYIRIQYFFTASGGNNILQINSLNIKLAIKQRADSGTSVYDLTKTDTENFVPFDYKFIYADIPIVQPNSTVPLTAMVIYSGGSSPTGFSIRLYDRVGSLVSAPYSWSVRGY